MSTFRKLKRRQRPNGAKKKIGKLPKSFFKNLTSHYNFDKRPKKRTAQQKKDKQVPFLK